jgi:hypothetical protein
VSAKDRSIGERIARAIAPEAWRQFDRSPRASTNEVGAACLSSIDAARRVLKVLKAADLIKSST